MKIEQVAECFEVAVEDALDQLLVGEYRDGMCDGQFSETQRTLSIANTGMNGMANLQIDARVVKTQNKVKGEECESTDSEPVASRTILKYDKDHYEVPSELSFLGSL